LELGDKAFIFNWYKGVGLGDLFVLYRYDWPDGGSAIKDR